MVVLVGLGLQVLPEERERVAPELLGLASIVSGAAWIEEAPPGSREEHELERARGRGEPLAEEAALLFAHGAALGEQPEERALEVEPELERLGRPPRRERGVQHRSLDVHHAREAARAAEQERQRAAAPEAEHAEPRARDAGLRAQLVERAIELGERAPIGLERHARERVRGGDEARPAQARERGLAPRR